MSLYDRFRDLLPPPMVGVQLLMSTAKMRPIRVPKAAIERGKAAAKNKASQKRPVATTPEQLPLIVTAPEPNIRQAPSKYEALDLPELSEPEPELPDPGPVFDDLPWRYRPDVRARIGAWHRFQSRGSR